MSCKTLNVYAIFSLTQKRTGSGRFRVQEMDLQTINFSYELRERIEVRLLSPACVISIQATVAVRDFNTESVYIVRRLTVHKCPLY